MAGQLACILSTMRDLGGGIVEPHFNQFKLSTERWSGSIARLPDGTLIPVTKDYVDSGVDTVLGLTLCYVWADETRITAADGNPNYHLLWRAWANPFDMPVESGNPIVYTITLFNRSEFDASDIIIENILPNNITPDIVPLDPITVPLLAAGESLNLEITGILNSDGVTVDTANIVSFVSSEIAEIQAIIDTEVAAEQAIIIASAAAEGLVLEAQEAPQLLGLTFNAKYGDTSLEPSANMTGANLTALQAYLVDRLGYNATRIRNWLVNKFEVADPNELGTWATSRPRTRTIAKIMQILSHFSSAKAELDA